MYGNQIKQLTNSSTESKKSIISSIFGSLMSIPIFLYTLSKAQCETWYEAVIWAIGFTLFNFGLNVSHSLFERRSFYVHLIHCKYHAISFILISITLTTLV